jgi:hypothetical protein
MLAVAPGLWAGMKTESVLRMARANDGVACNCRRRVRSGVDARGLPFADLRAFATLVLACGAAAFHALCPVACWTFIRALHRAFRHPRAAVRVGLAWRPLGDVPVRALRRARTPCCTTTTETSCSASCCRHSGRLPATRESVCRARRACVWRVTRASLRWASSQFALVDALGRPTGVPTHAHELAERVDLLRRFRPHRRPRSGPPGRVHLASSIDSAFQVRRHPTRACSPLR